MDHPVTWVPDGRIASAQEMHDYGKTLQAFVKEQEALLPTLSDMKEHNDRADYLNLLADAYNEQLRVYRETDAARRQTLVMGLLQMAGMAESRI